MHLIVEDTRSLDAAEIAEDLGQSAADIVFLSFSDSDLAAFASAWGTLGETGASLRLANLNRLKHPFSVDLYVEKTIASARVVIIRLLGGLDYWRYGVDECAAIVRAKGIRLAIVPGDYREDGRLDVASTMAEADLRRIWQWFQAGGPENMRSAVAFALEQTGLPEVRPTDWREPVEVGSFGTLAAASMGNARGLKAGSEKPLALVLLYRSIVAAADTAPFPVLAEALAARGMNVATRFVTSLKDPAVVSELSAFLTAARPDVIVNTTAFSAKLDDATTVLDRADCPVIQAMLSTASREAWEASGRGLSAADLAMNVVLPELDGRIISTAISFKAPLVPDTALEFTRLAHHADPDRIALVAERAARWVRLRAQPNDEKKLALILSNYPAKAGRTGYAVGLDTEASARAIAEDLRSAGYAVGGLPEDLIGALEGRVFALPAEMRLPIADYRRLFDCLPDAFRASVIAAHGEPTVDPTFPVIEAGNLLVALQPDRGRPEDRKDEAHDLTRPPGHTYIGFYLWLREVVGIDALIHLGTHGTLEWLPGKAVALDAASAPEAVLGAVPVLYPFIVNNPGEAAQARRRIAAVTIGHLTPPLTEAGTSGDVAEIESWLDEYAQAQVLDPKRAVKLAEAILDRTRGCGLAAEIGIAPDAEPGEALQRLDARICDIKEMRVGDGLHVFGRAPDAAGRETTIASLAALSGHGCQEIAAIIDRSATGEMAGLLGGLEGRFVPPGPAGAPSRGRLDVLPTGRNLTSIDPRAIPTPTAWEIGKRSASELLMRHAQDHGDWPKRLVVDLWGSATMRTGGEQLAEALSLLGVRPEWEAATGRVTGFTILPGAKRDFPRVDVTLRISGLFRDVFPGAIALFDEAVQAVAGLDEAQEDNPLAGLAKSGRVERIFGSVSGSYGAGGLASAAIEDGDVEREALGQAYITSATHAFSAQGEARSDGFARRVETAEAYVHTTDLADVDLLSGDAFVDHVGGFAAAAKTLGVTPAVYVQDATDPTRPKTRTLAEDLGRTIRARAANPRWIEGQMRHGHRGAAEIAESVEAVYAFAVTSETVTSSHFDVLFDATLGSDVVRTFIERENPLALQAIATAFDRAQRRGLWSSRRNSTGRILAELMGAPQ